MSTFTALALFAAAILVVLLLARLRTRRGPASGFSGTPSEGGHLGAGAADTGYQSATAGALIAHDASSDDAPRWGGMGGGGGSWGRSSDNDSSSSSSDSGSSSDSSSSDSGSSSGE